MILSVDPGKRSGWATWGEDGTLLDHGILDVEEMLALLHRWPWPHHRVRAVVAEDYALDYRASRQQGSKLEAVQVIGALMLFARQENAVVVKQRTEARDMGYLHMAGQGLRRAGSHKDSHDLDAIAHGGYWLETQGVEPDLAGL